MSSIVVHAERLRKTYRTGNVETVVLDVAGVELAAGENVAIVGPSGSGKTTLLHLIAGLDIPSTGTIEWPALGPREVLRPGKVAVAFQGPSLVPSLNVLENVAMPALLAGMGGIQAFNKAREILERMALMDIAAKLPEELSGGQSQRVGIARALVNNPALLLADEPTGQQDHENGNLIMDNILSYAQETGASLVIATHDISMAHRLSAVWSMENGHLQTGGASHV